VEREIERFYFHSDEEETLAAWLATKLFIDENFNDDAIDFDRGKELSPWLLNRRIGQF